MSKEIVLFNHPAYEIVKGDWQLTELALLTEQMQADVDYHHFGHPLDTLENIRKLADQYEQDYPQEPPLDRRRLYTAALAHDWLEAEPLEGTSFPTREHRSAFLIGYICSELRYTAQEISDMQADIISTNPAYPCQDRHAVLLVKADIGNVADDYENFVSKFVDVYKETQKKRIKTEGLKALVNPCAAREGSIAFLCMYFRQDLSLGEKDLARNGMNKFVFDAMCNFFRLQAVPESEMLKIQDELISEL